MSTPLVRCAIMAAYAAVRNAEDLVRKEWLATKNRQVRAPMGGLGRAINNMRKAAFEWQFYMGSPQEQKGDSVHPLIVIHGPHNSGKTGLADVLRSVLAPLGALPYVIEDVSHVDGDLTGVQHDAFVSHHPCRVTPELIKMYRNVRPVVVVGTVRLDADAFGGGDVVYVETAKHQNPVSVWCNPGY